MKQPTRVYIDSSVFGGVFDDEFSKASSAFFRKIRIGEFRPVTSAVVRSEVAVAPDDVQGLFADIAELAEIVDVSDDALRLMRGYIDGGILSDRWSDDALHVALATVAGCSLIVSWNFRHIVHYQKIPRYNAVNILQGYSKIAIHSPLEVIADED